MDDRIVAAREAVLAAGELVRDRFGKRADGDVEEKDRNDYVTGTDMASEELIVSMLTTAFPDIPVMAEEGGGEVGEKLFWVIDPLDGTTNFIHGYPQVGVSVALIEERRPVAGVTYDPLRNELFEAGRGEGAFCNGQRLSVSSEESLERCLLGTGFPFRTYEYLDPYLATFRELFLRCRGVRRAGAAVLDLAHVAAGRLDGFWELYLGDGRVVYKRRSGRSRERPYIGWEAGAVIKIGGVPRQALPLAQEVDVTSCRCKACPRYP
jgi:myo-inositol-1(or 4)-monophosphatase